MKKSTVSPETILRTAGSKATTVRLALISLLQQNPSPLSIEQITKKLKKSGGDTATIYRSLNAFVAAGIVTQLSLTPEYAHFELVQEKNHAHHIICKTCGDIENIDFCIKNISEKAKTSSKKFKTIIEHTISFLGTCKTCARAVR